MPHDMLQCVTGKQRYMELVPPPGGNTKIVGYYVL